MIIFICIAVAFAYNYDDLAVKRCSGPHQPYSIHGWWPEYNKTSYPQFCNNTKCKLFNLNLLTPIYGSLKKYWFSCPEFNFSDEKFWRHEWCKHGSCVSDDLLTFFNRTIQIFLTTSEANWYGCCSEKSEYNQCLIHFNKTTINWLGYC